MTKVRNEDQGLILEPHSQKKKPDMRYTLLFPVLGKWEQVDFWGSLASQLLPLGEFQPSEMLCLKKQSIEGI